jgi:ubiquinone/menaquinone biosynthesis C-methylase UbiE
MPLRSLDAKNEEFWNELCGSALARSIGITERTSESLRKFDEAYLRFYPYLRQYVEAEDLTDRRVLEVGLGYGTLGGLIASRTRYYHGLDLASAPVVMMRNRLGAMRQGYAGNVVQGSALAMPYTDARFDYLYSIGCLHHTGDLPQAISEVHRVLVPGGKAIMMV